MNLDTLKLYCEVARLRSFSRGATASGVSQSAAVGYALVFHAAQIVPVTLIGWLYLLREHMSLGEATRARPPAGETA